MRYASVTDLGSGVSTGTVPLNPPMDGGESVRFTVLSSKAIAITTDEEVRVYKLSSDGSEYALATTVDL